MTEQDIHAEHTTAEHAHGADCGHEAVQHGDHVDYVHGGHPPARLRRSLRRHSRGQHPRSSTPTGRTAATKAVQHGDHVDYVHGGHKHAAHGDHYDEH